MSGVTSASSALARSHLPLARPPLPACLFELLQPGGAVPATCNHKQPTVDIIVPAAAWEGRQAEHTVEASLSGGPPNAPRPKRDLVLAPPIQLARTGLARVRDVRTPNSRVGTYRAARPVTLDYGVNPAVNCVSDRGSCCRRTDAALFSSIRPVFSAA